ncbi:MAG: nicotinate-nucleotide adenylyltransferase [Paludibacteraceae bacterium]|nr:nicotinate-nucleotide adenylyltransferase [Paludibacteraceae bacterium]MBN2787587.1 nicotinate-nucleotide adenylyltransferase [Paludibacteraceae bacterium]
MIGLLFGSFNPIHLGHTALASYLLKHAGLDEIWFVVSPHNPLKEQNDLMPDDSRLKMVKLAIADYSAFKACDVEFFLPTPNYTITTLQHLNELYPEKQFALIIGADNLDAFSLWRDYKNLLNNYSILVYPRKGYDLDALQKEYPQVKVVEAPLFPISSTEIRQLLKEKKDASPWLHPSVYKFLLDN